MSLVRDSQRVFTPSVRMGEMAVAMDEGTLQTLLGSCVGVALYDRNRKIGGLAHIVLPCSQGNTELPGKYVDTAVPALIRNMEKEAGGSPKLVGKIAGGASMFSTQVTRNIGMENVKACEELLGALRIPILARDCGGDKGRRMSLDIRTGLVVIEIVGRTPYQL